METTTVSVHLNITVLLPGLSGPHQVVTRDTVPSMIFSTDIHVDSRYTWMLREGHTIKFFISELETELHVVLGKSFSDFGENNNHWDDPEVRCYFVQFDSVGSFDYPDMLSTKEDCIDFVRALANHKNFKIESGAYLPSEDNLFSKFIRMFRDEGHED